MQGVDIIARHPGHGREVEVEQSSMEVNLSVHGKIENQVPNTWWEDWKESRHEQLGKHLDGSQEAQWDLIKQIQMDVKETQVRISTPRKKTDGCEEVGRTDIWDDEATPSVLQIGEIPLTCTVAEKNRIRKRILEYYGQGQDLYSQGLLVPRKKQKRTLVN